MPGRSQRHALATRRVGLHRQRRVLTSTATDFHLRESLHAKKGDQDFFFTREQVAVIKRDLV